MPRKPRLTLPRVARQRSTWAQRTGTATRGASLLFKAHNQAVEFHEDAEGRRIRHWRPEELQRYTLDDIKTALRGQHVVELEDVIEYIPERAVGYCVTKGWLFKDGPFYRVTRKAAAELDLPRTVGGRKIRFFDSGL
jgi:hypothetical protein